MHATQPVTEAMQHIKHGTDKADAIRGAIAMRRESDNFERWANRFAVYASWHGRAVTVNNVPWIPLEGDMT